MPNTSITVSFACTNSAMAAKMIEYFDRLSAESMQQLSNSLKDHHEQWTEFVPDGSSRPAAEPVNLTPPHVSHPNSSAVPPNAAGSAPASYQQQQYAPPAQSAPPAPPAPPAPSAQPMPQQPSQPPQVAPQTAPSAQQQQPPNYQQTAMTYTPAPNTMPAASAPVIKREQLNQALQVFASSSQAHQIQVRELLARFGVDALNALPDHSIPEFVNSLRELGCYI